MSTANTTGVQPNIIGGPLDGGMLPPPTRKRHALLLTPYGAEGIPDSFVYVFHPQRERWIYSPEGTEAANKPKAITCPPAMGGFITSPRFRYMRAGGASPSRVTSGTLWRWCMCR